MLKGKLVAHLRFAAQANEDAPKFDQSESLDLSPNLRRHPQRQNLSLTGISTILTCLVLLIVTLTVIGPDQPPIEMCGGLGPNFIFQ